MGQVGDLVGAERAAAASMVWPAEHAGLEEGAVDDQLAAALEQIEQAHLALGSVEPVLLVHGQPWHPPALGGQRVTGAGQRLLFHEELLTRSLPFLRRHDRWCVHCQMLLLLLHATLLAGCHFILLLLLLDFLKQTETTRAKNFSELADPHHQNSSRGSRSGGHHCCACDAYRAHKHLPGEQLCGLGPLHETRWLIG